MFYCTSCGQGYLIEPRQCTNCRAKHFKFRTDGDALEKPFWLEWWHMHDWEPKPGVLVQANGLITYPDGERYYSPFAKGYILEVYPDREMALCFFPTPVGAPWIKPKCGTVEYVGMAPITECGFQPKLWKSSHPCPSPAALIAEFKKARSCP
jgi:hypothetical protein